MVGDGATLVTTGLVKTGVGVTSGVTVGTAVIVVVNGEPGLVKAGVVVTSGVTVEAAVVDGEPVAVVDGEPVIKGRGATNCWRKRCVGKINCTNGCVRRGELAFTLVRS